MVAYQLLAAGAAINLPDISGITPLMYAAMSGDCQTVRTLLASGANVHARAHSGFDALKMARNCNHRRAASLLESSMEKELALD